MARIFFTAYGGGHVAMLAPVARQALDAGHDVQFLALTTARSALAGSGIPLLGFDDLWEFAGPGARAHGLELTAQIAPGGPVSLDESIAYMGISFADLVEQRGDSEARSMFAEKGRHAFRPKAFFERVLAHIHPDIVVATSSPRSEQAALLASGALGIPSVCVVDLFALQEIEWCGRPGYGTRVCVLSPQVRELFLRHGREPEEIILTGNPAFDRLTAPGAHEKGRALKDRRDWSDDRLTILWASQIEPETHPFNGAQGDPSLPRRIEQQLRKFVRDHKGYRLVVRYHPSEQEKFVSEPHVELSPTVEQLDALLHAVDIVVVTASTVGLEAAIVGKPVISVDQSVITPNTRFAEFGVSTGVRNPEALPVALIELSGGGNLAPTAARAPLDGFGGGAARRVFDVIESLLPSGVST